MATSPPALKPENPPTPKPENPGFNDFFKRLVASVVQPIWDFVLRSRWWVRASVLVLLCLVWLGWNQRDWVLARVGIIRTLPSAITNSKSLPLRASERSHLDAAVKALATYLDAELHLAHDTNPNHNVWGLSQMVIALDNGQAINPQSITGAFEAKRSEPCHCWTEYKDRGYPHTATVNWASVALARLGVKLSSNDLRFILENQHSDGWWAPFPALDQRENASTYATAWSILALHEQLAAGLIDDTDKSNVRAAIERGKAWLLSTRAEGAHWKDYPYASNGLWKQSVGLSGLVLHVLHRLGAANPDIDRDWLSELPTEIPTATDADANPYPVTVSVGVSEKDGVRQLRLPWTIIATVDAYPNGSLWDRSRALRFISSLSDRFSQLPKPVMADMPWAAAELEISLRYLQNDRRTGKEII